MSSRPQAETVTPNAIQRSKFWSVHAIELHVQPPWSQWDLNYTLQKRPSVYQHSNEVLLDKIELVLSLVYKLQVDNESQAVNEKVDLFEKLITHGYSSSNSAFESNAVVSKSSIVKSSSNKASSDFVEEI